MREAGEAELIGRARAGHPDAWRELYVRHAGAVRRLCGAFGQLSSADLEDCVQESFVRAFQNLGKLEDPERFRPWLFAIARSRCLSRLEKRANEQRTRRAYEVDPAAGVSSPAFDAGAARREARIAIVRELIEALPAGVERDTVELYYLGGELSAREIAERMGVGKSAVTMRLERFRAKLKKKLALHLATLEREEG